MTIAAVMHGQEIEHYLNKQRVLDVNATFAMGPGQLFINSGVGGSFRLAGIRYYNLPSSS